MIIPNYITKLLLLLFLSREFLLVPMNTVIPILWFFMSMRVLSVDKIKLRFKKCPLKETNVKIMESDTTTRLPLVTFPVPAYWTLLFLFTIYAFTPDYQ